MFIFKVIILPILLVLISFVIASFLTPIFVLLYNKITTKNPIANTNYKIGSIYIPQPIKNIGKLFKFNKGKHPIKTAIVVKKFSKTSPNPLPKDSLDIVQSPFDKLGTDSIPNTVHSPKSNIREK